jgi:hypothetical protein
MASGLRPKIQSDGIASPLRSTEIGQTVLIIYFFSSLNDDTVAPKKR